MRGRLFTVASVLSLLLCVATVVLWVRSYLAPYYGPISRGADGSYTAWVSAYGRFGRGFAAQNELTGKWLVSGAYTGTDYIQLFTILAILPFLHFLTWAIKREAARRKGTCLTCGYNLTGNTSGVCPECGTPTVQALSTKSY